MGVRRRVVTVAAVTAIAGGVVGSGHATRAAADGSWSVSPVVGGLASPRGVSFDGLGAMYVAESGLPGPDAQGVTQTGAVDKYSQTSGGFSKTWSTTFTSLYSNDENGASATGPEGISATGSGCMKNGSGQRNGCQILVILSGSAQQLVDQGGPPVPQIGHLFRMDGATGAATDNGDIGDQDYQWTTEHKDLFPNDFPDANPYGVLAEKGSAHRYVVDAAANTVETVDADGRAHVIAYIPNETPEAGLPLRDATPTCVAEGPDGALYVGTLDLVRNFIVPSQGQSHVYRIDPGAHENPLTAAHLWASGLTTVTACAFDRQGNFWAAEMFKGNEQAPPGDVVRIPLADPGTVEHIGGGELPVPGGIAQGPDGAMYVTVGSTGSTTADGAVMRLAQS